MPIVRNRRQLALKVESAAGTAEALTVSEAGHEVYDLTIEPNIEFVQRVPGRASHGTLAAVPGVRAGTASFRLPLRGKGSSGVPAWGDLLKGCGMALNTATYSPSSVASNKKTLTIGAYCDGLFKKIHGAMGNVTFEFVNGQICWARFEFQGIWNAPTDVALVAPTYETTVPPRWAGGTFTLGSNVPLVTRAEINLGNQVMLREGKNPGTAGDASGIYHAFITGRAPTLTMDAEADTVASWDAFGQLLAGTELALSLVLGASSNNILTFAAPKVQITQAPEADRNGLAIHNLTCQLNTSAAAGEDELTLVFS